MGKPKNNDFASRLKAARKLRGWTQLELERASGVAVAHFENGSRLPSYDNLCRFIDALEVSADYIMGVTDEPSLFGNDSVARQAAKLTGDDRQLALDFIELLANRRFKLDQAAGRASKEN